MQVTFIFDENLDLEAQYSDCSTEPERMLLKKALRLYICCVWWEQFEIELSPQETGKALRSSEELFVKHQYLNPIQSKISLYYTKCKRVFQDFKRTSKIALGKLPSMLVFVLAGVLGKSTIKKVVNWLSARNVLSIATSYQMYKRLNLKEY